MIVGSSLFFPMIHMKYVVFMPLWPRTVKILISNWSRMQKISQLFKTTGGEDLFFHGYALVTLCVQFLYSDWSKFDRWVHMENLCSILKVILLWQLKLTDFCVNLWCFYWMYKMKYSYYQGSSVFHGWFVYCVFGWEMHRLSKLGNWISDGIVFVFHLAWCLRGFKSLKQLWPSLISVRNWISNGKPEQLLYLMFVFVISNFMKSWSSIATEGE